jgi:hypothetical protein
MRMTKVACLIAATLLLTAGGVRAQHEILAPVNDAVNAMLGALGAPNHDATRVVPIVAAGGTTAGYAQIAGPQSRVAATRAVLKISSTSPNGWSIDAFVPVTSVSRGNGAVHRAYGVAVDAIVNGEQ